jgi:hypothetical protein
MKSLIGGALLASSVFVSGINSPVRALTLAGQTNFPVCAAATDEFCIETFEFTPTGGALRAVTPIDRIVPDNTEVNVIASFPNAYTGPNGIPDQSGMLGPLSLNFYDTGSFQNSTTIDGLRDGTYRVVLRTGDYDPSLMTLTGQFASYSVVQGTDNNFTIDISATPKPLARAVQLDGDNSAIANCETNNWVGTCAANQASRLYLEVSFSMMYVAEYRAAMRGAWVATNASTVQTDIAGLAQGQLNVTAKGPHTVPADFGTTSAGLENGNYLNPAYFEEYLPFTMMSLMMSSISTTTVTTDMVRGLLANPATFMTGSISVSASGGTPVATAQNITVTTDSNGARVNFNLTHFSAPNPSLVLKIPASLVVPKKPTVTTKKTATAKSLAIYKKLTVAKTSTVSLKVSTASKRNCAVVATKVKGVTTMKLKGLKKGTCKVTVTVTPKKGSAKRATVTLQIT